MTNNLIGVHPESIESMPNRRSLNVGFIVGAAMFALLVVIAIVAPIVLGDKASLLTSNASQPPSAEHFLGTDSFGRDLFARALVATRLTLTMAFAATVISVGGGIAFGVGIWLAPARARRIALRLIEAMVAFPGLLFALVIAAILGPGATTVVVAIGVTGIASFARLTSNLAAGLAGRDFVTTARLMGVPSYRIALKHLIPNMAEPLLVVASTSIAVALLEISALSFIGLGVQSPDFDYGKLLNDALETIYSRPTELIGPVVMIVFAGLAATLIGDGLASMTNPRVKQKYRPSYRANSASTDTLGAGEENAVLEVENLQITSSSGISLVRGVSFSVEHGEVLGIVGESGSGKSLTAMAIAQLLPDDLEVEADRLRLLDIDLRKPAEPKRIADALGLVYQDPGSTFSPALKIGRQVGQILRSHHGFSRKNATERVIEAFESVRITRPAMRVRQYPHELSGGMRQRAMIASAITTDPALMIADEPTTALDVTVQLDVLREFKRLNLENGVAMVFISHDLGVVEALCDRVLVMQKGEIVEEILPAQLRNRDVTHPYTASLLNATPTIRDFKSEDSGAVT
ncbi:peptide/nickel transport system permease protein [Rhodococcus sp. 27YEA15]|uniref:dipeptide/oligopeptide/nickel ABC transporter permease/ATP-binding protein n=1 Tax=Rhodococcus sp. 27YEA15 TaxID=3156259 RepID=UPI003C7C120D